MADEPKSAYEEVMDAFEELERLDRLMAIVQSVKKDKEEDPDG